MKFRVGDMVKLLVEYKGWMTTVPAGTIGKVNGKTSGGYISVFCKLGDRGELCIMDEKELERVSA